MDTQLRQKLGIVSSGAAPEVPAVPVNGAVVAQEAVKPAARRQ
jgi:recombination protein RecA